jgi:transposase
MHPFTLSLSERRALKQQIRETKDTKVLKRSQALLWLTEGVPIPEIAKRLAVTRQTIYGWISFYRSQVNKSFITRLKDRPKSGRPTRKSAIVLNELDTLLQKSPRQYGYRHVDWTVPLLRQAIQDRGQIEVSTKTIRRCLKQHHYVWKRPRYTLAREFPTWAQEKGGSNEGSRPLQDASSSLWMKPF